MKSKIEVRSGIPIRVDKGGGCGPATLFEVELSKRVQQLEAAYKALETQTADAVAELKVTKLQLSVSMDIADRACVSGEYWMKQAKKARLKLKEKSVGKEVRHRSAEARNGHLCGARIPQRQNSKDNYACCFDRWDRVTCLKCLAKRPKEKK